MPLSTYGMWGRFTPENILEFSNNCPNLESISFFIKIGHKNINQMKHAFNTFFNAKRQTLKSFAITRIYQYANDHNVNESSVLENINLCQNLEELSVYQFDLQNSTLIDIINLPKIKTLILNGTTLRKTGFTTIPYLQGSIFMNLKYLKLEYHKDKGNLSSFNLVFSKIKFPVLERFGLEILEWTLIDEDEIFINALYQLFHNSPKLKSVQLYGKCFHNEDYRKISQQFCKERSIFVSFGIFPGKNRYEIYQEFQNDFDMKLTIKDPITKIKYDNLKANFLAWESKNKWWTCAMECN